MILPFNRNKNTIFLDMDRVLVDYDRFIQEKFGHLFKDGQKQDDALIVEELQKVDHLYLSLPPMPYAERLVKLAFLYGRDVQILTALPSRWTIKHAEDDKREWIKRNFSEKLICNVCDNSRHKYEWAKNGDILVDDKLSNITSWQLKGMGNGILHNPHDYALTATRLIYLCSEPQFDE